MINKTITILAFLIILSGCSQKIATIQPNYIDNDPPYIDEKNHEYYLISQPPILFPAYAFKQGIEGYVVVEHDIDDKGNSINQRVAKSEKGEFFDQAAMKHVSKCKYSPRTINGVAVMTKNVWTKVTFCLKGSEKCNEYKKENY